MLLIPVVSYFLTIASALNVPATQKIAFLHEISWLKVYQQAIYSCSKTELE
jgi:hypothetical protein